MTQLLYKRKIILTVSTSTGDGLDLSKLRIVFDIKLMDSQTPNTARIRVYNLSQDTISRIQKEFTEITFQAGYESNFGIIFTGNIKQVVYGSEDNIDTFIDISAGDGDEAYNSSIVNVTLASGSNQSDISSAALQPMIDKGIDRGFIEDAITPSLPRSKVMYGMSRDYLRESSENAQTTWSIQAGKYQSVKLTGVLPDEAVVLNSKTGLVYTPNQTNNGVVARSLLNPNIKVASSVNINQNDIQLQLIDGQTVGQDVQSSAPSPISSDGFYRVLIAEHMGDTRGNDWYTEITCLSMDKTSDEDNQVETNG